MANFRTPAFEAFVAPAKGRSTILTLFLGICLTIAVYVVLAIAVLAIWLVFEGVQSVDEARLTLAGLIDGSAPEAVLVLLATFIGLFVGPMLAVRFVHGAPMRTVFGNRTLRGFLISLVVTGLIFGLTLYFLPPPFEMVPNLDMDVWLMFLPLALLGLLVQTGAEEVAFRGYLQPYLAARFRSPLIWALVPSLLFGLAHWQGTDGDTAIWIVAAATLFGVIAMDLTRVTGSIGAAWGFHMANNTFAVLILSLQGNLSGLSLYMTPFTSAETDILRPLIVQDMVLSIVVWAILRFVLSRKL